MAERQSIIAVDWILALSLSSLRKHDDARLTGILLNYLEFEMLHDDEVIPKYAANIVIGRVKGQTPSLEL